MRIPLAKPQITEADRAAVDAVLRSDQVSNGPQLTEFESRLARVAQQKHALAVNSGTSALQIALRTLNLPRGSEVILPSFTFNAPLNAILLENFNPVFVDIDAESMNCNLEELENAIDERTGAIVAVHTFGRPLQMKEVRRIASRKAIPVIEDACEAIGAVTGDRPAGGWGDFGLFAFYPNKQITCGEGGVLFTSKDEHVSRALRLRSQGRDSVLDWLDQREVGFSFRLSDMNCALGLSQLERIEEIVALRQRLAEQYDARLARVRGLERPPTYVPAGRISWFCYVVRLSSEFSRSDRDRVCVELRKKGIGAGRYFAPLHLQPVMKGFRNRFNLDTTVAVADRVIALPFFHELTSNQIDEVGGALEEAMAER